MNVYNLSIYKSYQHCVGEYIYCPSKCYTCTFVFVMDTFESSCFFVAISNKMKNIKIMKTLPKA